MRLRDDSLMSIYVEVESKPLFWSDEEKYPEVRVFEDCPIFAQKRQKFAGSSGSIQIMNKKEMSHLKTISRR